MRCRRLGPVALVACLLASSAAAQVSPGLPLPGEPAIPEPPAPASLSYIDGRVNLVGADGVQPAQAPDLLEEGDRLVTAEGRAELVFDDGTVAHVERQSDVRIDLGVRLRLVSGRILVHTPADVESLYVATPAGPLRLAADGSYDIAADDLRGDTVIAVRRGHAALVTGDRETPVSTDDVLSVDPRDPRPRWARRIASDAFVDWSERRLDAAAAAHEDALPAPLQPWAADLAAHGRWSTLPTYGAVWFPSAGPSWRPYQDGSWRHTRYGWTWIDTDRWAWPVHHYGRWGHHAARGWYWMPDRAWGPAWVGWAVGANHVAWSPLGWNRRPLVDFTLGARLGPVSLFASSWSILPRHAFGRRGSIYRDLQDPRALSGPVLGGFVSQMIAPRGPAGPGDRFAARPRDPSDGPPLPRRVPAQAAGASPRWPGSHVVPSRAPSARRKHPPCAGQSILRPSRRRCQVPGRASGRRRRVGRAAPPPDRGPTSAGLRSRRRGLAARRVRSRRARSRPARLVPAWRRGRRHPRAHPRNVAAACAARRPRARRHPGRPSPRPAANRHVRAEAKRGRADRANVCRARAAVRARAPRPRRAGCGLGRSAANGVPGPGLMSE